MNEDHEFEQRPPQIEWLGPIGGEQPNPRWWRGTISAKLEILKTRFGLDEEGVLQKLAELKDRVGELFIEADPNAQVRCIDGRNESEDTRQDGLGLGPQVSGGTPVSAFTYRLAAPERLPGEHLKDDLLTVAGIVSEKNLPFLPGAHEDNKSAASDEKTGCGAIDKMLEIVSIMADREAMYPYVRAVMGEDFSEEAFEQVWQQVREYAKPTKQQNYFKASGKTLIKNLKELGRRKGRKAVEKLEGDHNELFVIINKVHGQTFDRDSFSSENDHKAQAFNYDYWHVVERADALFPDDEGARARVITAQVMYVVGTAMALTDGSLELGIRA